MPLDLNLWRSVCVLLLAWALIDFNPVLAETLHVPSIPRPQSQPASTAAAKTLSQSLAKRDRQQLAMARECAKDVAGVNAREKSNTLVAEFELRYEVLLDTPQIYSLVQRLNIHCIGPYPAFAENALVFDLATGQHYNPLRLYAITRNGPDGAEFLPEIRTLIRQALIAGRQPTDQKNECLRVLKRDDIRLLEKDTLGLGAQGLHVMYSGPHVVQACYGDVVLPYARLKKFLNTQEAQRIHWVH